MRAACFNGPMAEATAVTADAGQADAPPKRGLGAVAVNVVAAAALLALGAYLVVASQTVLWSGDVRSYVAAVREVMAHPFSPTHECLVLPATDSLVMSPYLWWVAGLGRLFRLGAYEALQFGAAFNVLLLLSGALHLASTEFWGGRRHFLVVAALYFALTLFGRDENFNMSAELSGRTLPMILAYPSVFVWGLALHALAVAEAALRGGGVRRWGLLFVCLWLALTSHALTGSWLVGIVGLRGLAEAVRRPTAEGLRAGATLVAVVVASFAATPLWPFVPFLKTDIVGQVENSRLADHPFSTFQALYVLAAMAAVRLAVARDARVLWLFAVWLSSTIVHFILTKAGIDFGARYIYFMAVPAQWAVALQAAKDIEQLRAGRWMPRAIAGVSLAVVAAGVHHVAHVNLDRMTTPSALLALPKNPAARYVADLAPFARHLKQRHVAFVGEDSVGMRLVAATGARVVNVRFQAHIKDQALRRRDERNFYSPLATPANRKTLAKRWGATHALLLPAHKAQRDAFVEAFGAPVAEHKGMALFATGVKPKPDPKAKPKGKPDKGKAKKRAGMGPPSLKANP